MHIYKITNLINGKIYIGLSTEKEKFRWYKHCSDAKNNPKNLIDRAIAKYGQNNFVLEILEKISKDKSIDYLGERETFYINKFNSRDKKIGYNVALGGKISTGYTWNENSKYKLLNSIKNKKAILSYDLKGNFLKEYETIADAARDINRTRASILQALNIKNRSCHNKQWRIKENENFIKKIEVFNRAKPINRKKVYQFTKVGEFIKEFESIREASKETKIGLSSIQHCVNKRIIFTSNYYFSYKKEFQPRNNYIKIPNKKINKILVYDQNKKLINEFNSRQDCINFYKFDPSSLSKILNKFISSIVDKSGKDYYVCYKGDESNLDFKKNNIKKKVLMLDEDNNIIKKFESLTEAKLKTGFKGISISCNNLGTRCFNFYFCFENDFDKFLRTKKKKSKYKGILQYDLNGNFIAEYKSTRDAAKSINASERGIFRALNGGYSSNKFFWIYKIDDIFKKKINVPSYTIQPN
jgi:group I intron endonuclease